MLNPIDVLSIYIARILYRIIGINFIITIDYSYLQAQV